MLAKPYRLQKSKDIEMVFRRGKSFNNDFVFLKMKSNNLEISRFGFVIGTKISKKSTVRNKIKRRLREIIRKSLDNIKPGFDIIIGVTPEIIDKDYQDVNKKLVQLLDKARLI